MLLSIGILHIHIVTNKQVGEFINCDSEYLLRIAYGIVTGSGLRLVQRKILRSCNYLLSILHSQCLAFRISFVTIYTSQHGFHRIQIHTKFTIDEKLIDLCKLFTHLIGKEMKRIALFQQFFSSIQIFENGIDHFIG